MLGSPERSVVLGLDPTAKKSIGEFYLRALLLASGGEVNSSVRTPLFETVDNSIFNGIQVRIPSILVKSLGLDKLTWKHIGEIGFLTILTAAGFSNQENASNVSQACATIEVSRKMRGHRLDNKEEATDPLFLRIAGVHNATGDKRIVAATYDLTENGRLAELDISIPVKECSSERGNEWDSSDPRISPESLTVNLPTYLDTPYHTAALVTKQMHKEATRQCEETTGIRGSAHDRALPFLSIEGSTAPESALIIYGKKFLPYMELRKKIMEFMLSLGYYAKNEKGLITVGLQPGAAERRGIAPWEISIPSSLQKV